MSHKQVISIPTINLFLPPSQLLVHPFNRSPPLSMWYLAKLMEKFANLAFFIMQYASLFSASTPISRLIYFPLQILCDLPPISGSPLCHREAPDHLQPSAHHQQHRPRRRHQQLRLQLLTHARHSKPPGHHQPHHQSQLL